MMTSKFLGNMLIMSGFFLATGLNMGVAEAYVSNRYVDKGGCYLQKEYNYFMNQWTTNEVCRPKFIEEPVPQKIASPYTTTGSTDNIYLGPSYSNSYSAPATTYYTGPSLDAIHTARSTGNSWNGYGSASNYLLGSFGGGIGSYGYYNNYYPNSVFTYTPTTYSAASSWYYPSTYYDYDYDYYDYGYSYLSDSGTYNGNSFYTWADSNDNSYTYAPDSSYEDLVNMADGGLEW